MSEQSDFDPDSMAVARMNGTWFELPTTSLAEFSDWLTRILHSPRYQTISYSPKGEAWGSFPPVFSSRMWVLTHETDYRYATGFQDSENNALVAVVDVESYGNTLKVGLRWDDQASEFAQYFGDRMHRTYGGQLVRCSGEGRNVLPVEDAPPSDEREREKRWQPRSAADRCLIDQYFDVHNEQRQLAYFREDWIRLREGEFVQIPADIDNSMAQIITKARKRRAGE